MMFQIDAVRGDTYTMSETHSLSRSFGHGLLSLGAQPGDVVAVILPNMPEYAVVMLGASEAALGKVHRHAQHWLLREQLHYEHGSWDVGVHEALARGHRALAARNR